MSIPPLVCSTPPPPEQCEDDKDHEDFDLQYNLSPDDDEDNNEFNYGNYTTYNYQTATEPVGDIQWPHNVSETTDNIDKFSIKSEINSCDNITPISLNNDNTSKVEEAIIEDLNLIIDKDNIDSTDLEPCSKLESNKDDSSASSDNDSRIKEHGNSDVEPEDLAPTLESNESTSGSPYFNEEICDKETQEIVVCEVDVNDTTMVNEINTAETTTARDNLASVKGSEENVIESENVADVNKTVVSDDDFGDFEDFQFTNTQREQVLPISSENPWDDTCGSPAFVEFKANFDNNEIASKDSYDVSPEIEEPKVDDDDDDFGDFDDFKSSEPVKETMEDVNNHTPVFDVSLPDNEVQICESISGLLTPIFAEEILEPDDEIVGKLESFLSETWGHLIDIDVRQPYMVNWNNSLGQKTLLKALCIDSRNILFGPKWHYNMPKYAANLSAAPLQPQKQIQQSNSINTDSSEKTNKEPTTWVDPFTQDGQEYTYAEALLLDLEHLMATLDQMAHKHSTLKISELLSHACNTENESTIEPAKRPTDLDVFGDTPTPMNKIYSSTIKVQPVRHINLPDTHIFTPTDSETPRSKTIHYDTESNPVPIPMIENGKNEDNPSSDNTEIDNEYWEFQDFKAQNEVASIEMIQATEVKTEPQPPVNAVPSPSVTYQTQILQPIKMKPVMPTLNWPDPGEVKETFDDFSDFISNSTWNTDKGTNPSVLDKKVDEDAKETKEVNTIKLDCIDDDFNTFQTAPASTVTNDFLDTFTSPQIVSQNFIPKITPDNNKTILSESKDKNVDHSSMKMETKSPSLKASATDSMFKQMPNNNPIKHLTSDILQPTNASTSGFNRNQQNLVQILQPLSLEGYSQINWPNPGIDLQDLSRFNPVDSVHTIKNDGSVSGNSKGSSPAHNVSVVHKETPEDDIWGDFVSSVPKPQTATAKTVPTFLDDDEWTDFVSSPSVKPVNGLSTISLNVHTNLNMHKTNTNKLARANQMQLDIPQLNYITPKSNNRGIYTEKHFQNL